MKGKIGRVLVERELSTVWLPAIRKRVWDAVRYEKEMRTVPITPAVWKLALDGAGVCGA